MKVTIVEESVREKKEQMRNGEKNGRVGYCERKVEKLGGRKHRDER